MFANARQEGGLGAKSRGSKRNGSIWGAPWQMAVEDDGGRWCGCAVEVVVVVGLCIRKREAGGGPGSLL